jgi:5-oxoprolinase (ATP-hydrolysing)
MKSQTWKIWVDTGGTFTDCIAIHPQGKMLRLKVLSTGVLKGQVLEQINANTFRVQLAWPVTTDIFNGFHFSVRSKEGATPLLIQSADPVGSTVTLKPDGHNRIGPGDVFEVGTGEEVPVFAARLITQTGLEKKFPPIEMKLGSTRGTNALLERKGAKVAFLITKGFKDLLLIGTQQRPDLFSRHIKKPQPLYSDVMEVNERMEADGTVFKALDEKEINKIVFSLKNSHCDSVAIALLHSYKHPQHEKKLKDALTSAGYPFVSASHELSGQVKILQRAETTVANAYLEPIIHQYLHRIRQGLQQAQLHVMSSAGGLTHAKKYFPKDSLLSGPAGGVVGAAVTASLSGMERLITFDMGGTSTDVSLYDQRFAYRYESVVGDVKIFSPSLAIETIAAGGGSICDFDGHRLTVGPHSAGAAPGPACYGSGGPLTITDVNLLLGRADETYFSIPLYRRHAEGALEDLLMKLKSVTGKKPKAEAVLESLLLIANEKMAEAIKKVSIQQGHDPARFTLLGFGGAGGQHACTLAGMLNIPQVLIPYDAGLLSAYGIGHARIERFEEQQVLSVFSATEKVLPRIFKKLYLQGEKKLMDDGYARDEIIRDKELLFLRFKGQESAIEIPYNNGLKIPERFKKKYKTIYGHWLQREVEVESVRLVLAVMGSSGKRERKIRSRYKPSPDKRSKMFINNQWIPASIYRWEKLKPGAVISGPAMVVSENSTTVINDGWTLTLNENNHAVVKGGRKKATDQHPQHAAAEMELFSNRFTAVAQDMGALLQRTSFSVNVKERLDFSCAMMDAEGYLVVNAPHIPVHLGSMGVCVRAVKNAMRLKPGDVIITNHPAFGGSHLPDVTLIKPVFYQRKLVGYVANRAHHAEMGGTKPGSMPAHATTLEEEGVIIPPTLLVKKGNVQWSAIQKIFTSAKFPSRLVEENLADLNGALASVNHGEMMLLDLCRKFGASKVQHYMKALRKYAAQLLQEKINETGEQIWEAEEQLDDGSALKVKITVERNATLTIDFSGSAPVHPGNLNATEAIVRSVILYVLRLWVNQPIAMNEGLMEPVKVILPAGLLSPDFTSGKLPAVVGGNTEVSQRLTDTLLKALGLMACGQGTMNNFLFGNDRFGFYETICGGAGAGDGFNGADAVHTHMTNTRITDAEILELRYPVRLERFEIRKGSGGKGRWHGGDGAVREVVFKEAVEVNILSQHRRVAPFGLKGGAPGKTGEQKVIKKNGDEILLKGMDSAKAEAGDRVVIATPGGGGCGKPK